MIGAQIEEKLRVAFAPEYLEVVNESHQHRVPAGSETHFKVVLVSERFQQQRLVARHRAVYAALAEELAGGVHALALHTYLPDEWSALQDKTLSSPPCRGADKKR
ncbi:transcriptional regulator BolA [Serratia microhaemolytica]|uniref:transcriptional regulator BolA n=1 Tax=Serratia microhaemolytica TaxID=2675110 RepID=UPI000FDE0871|nr:transcriptional regulator BolA [Serratia microhaemolytica]